MPIDPQATKFLEVLEKLGLPDLDAIPVVETRAYGRQRRAMLPPGPDAVVTDYTLPSPRGGMLARLYKPQGHPSASTWPVLMWMHGGGFAIGSVEESDADCRNLAVFAECAVLSLEYPLAPEHPFPAAVQDCWSAFRWLHDNALQLAIDPKRIAVGGDSAGGNLAACVARIARDRGGPMPCFQVLLYPVTDLSNLDTGSYREFAVGHYLTRQGVAWFRGQYLPNPADYLNPDASPLLAADLQGLPPALILTAECDVLRDEGRAYAERLAQAGVKVVYENHAGMIHGFFSMWGFLDGGRKAVERVTEVLRDSFRR